MIDPILNLTQMIANAANPQIVGVTKQFNDVVGSTPVDFFMDQLSGYGHRVKHGHSIEYLPEIFSEFGLSGLYDAVTHWLRDMTSPHGVPLPFANELRTLLNQNFKFASEWLSINVGDLLGGGFSIAHSYVMYGMIHSAVMNQYLAPSTIFSLSIGIVSKLVGAMMTSNIITLGSALADIGTLLWGLSPALTLGISYFKEPISLAFVVETNVLWGSLAGFVSGTLATKLIANDPTHMDYIRNGALGAVVGGVAGSILSTDSTGLAIVGSSIAGATAVALHEVQYFYGKLLNSDAEIIS